MTYKQGVFRSLLTLQAPIKYESSLSIEVQILSDISDTSTEPLEGYINNLEFYIDKGTPFEPECFVNFLFEDSGLWTKVPLFTIPNNKDTPVFRDCFEPGCWSTFTHQAIETTYTPQGVVSKPIDIGYSPTLNHTSRYPAYNPDKRWFIEELFITAKTFSVYNILPNTSYDLLNGSTYTSPNTQLQWELLLDLDLPFRTNLDQSGLIDPCSLSIFVHLRNKSTNEIRPLLSLAPIEQTPILCAYTLADGAPLSTPWHEMGLLAAKDFLAYLRSTGKVGIFDGYYNPSNTFIDYTPYYSPHFTPNKDNRNVYLQHSNEVWYWAPGAKDKNGNVYLVDVGIFPSCGDVPYIVETNIPVASNGRFYSRTSLPTGKKYIQVRQITPTREHIVFTYAPYLNTLLNTLNNLESLPPQTNKLNCFQDKRVNLEHLSISLLLLSISNYVHTRDCEFQHNPPLIDPLVIDIIRKNFVLLNELRAPFTFPYARKDSIPLHLKGITCREAIYEDAYRDETYLMGWEKGVWEEGCFEDCVFLCPISRKVSNRAIGWLCYALGVYRSSINSSEFNDFLIAIGDYLIANMHPHMHLISNGWEDNEVYSESEQIDEYDMSVSCISCLALIKAYEQTGLYRFLEASVDIYEGILKYLMLPEEGVCADNTIEDTVSTDTLLYSLWLFTELGRADIVERLLSLLNTRVHSGLPLFSASLYNTDPSLGEVLYEGMDLVGAVELNPILHSYSLLNMHVQESERNQDISQTITQLLLLHGLSSLLPSEDYPSLINIPNTIDPLGGLNRLQDEGLTMSTHLSLELCKDIRFLNNSHVRIESRHLINSLIGYRNQAFSMVRAIIPVDFGWFHRRALTLSGTAGKLIWMFVRGISSLVVNKNRISESLDKANAIGINFDYIMEDLKLYRRPGEDKQTFLQRYIAYKTKGHNTKENIEKLLPIFNLPARLMDTPTLTYEHLNSTHSDHPEFTSIIDRGVINPSNTHFVVSSIPPSESFIQALEVSTHIGCDINLITHLGFPYPNHCLHPLSADVFMHLYTITSIPSTTISPLHLEGIFKPSCSSLMKVELSHVHKDVLYVNNNPMFTPSLYISQTLTPYTISIIPPGLSFVVVPIPLPPK